MYLSADGKTWIDQESARLSPAWHYQQASNLSQSLPMAAVAALTGAVAYPFSGVSLWRDAAIGAGVGGVNTVATNEMYGEGKDVVEGG